MGVWTGTVEIDGKDFGIAIDSVTMRPIDTTLFDDLDDVDGFVGWAAAQGYPDVRRLRAATLDVLRAQWEGARAEWLRLHGDDAEEADADLDAYDRQVTAEIEAEAAPDAARCADCRRALTRIDGGGVRCLTCAGRHAVGSLATALRSEAKP